jgi:hypothetical protein
MPTPQRITALRIAASQFITDIEGIDDLADAPAYLQNYLPNETDPQGVCYREFCGYECWNAKFLLNQILELAETIEAALLPPAIALLAEHDADINRTAAIAKWEELAEYNDDVCAAFSPQAGYLEIFSCRDSRREELEDGRGSPPTMDVNDIEDLNDLEINDFFYTVNN